jgi:hypothetical protein
MKHGSLYTYQQHGCRCEPCVEAQRSYNRAYGRDYRAGRLRGRPPAPPTPHGTIGGYTNRKCRCEMCSSAMAAYNRKRYAERKNA